MNSILKLFSLFFALILIFALCCLSFSVSAADSDWANINGLTFVLSDTFDLSRPTLTNFSFFDGSHSVDYPSVGYYSQFNCYSSSIIYESATSDSSLTAYRVYDSWLQDYYKSIYIFGIDINSVSYSQTVANLKYNSVFVYRDLYDLRGIQFSFSRLRELYVSDVGTYDFNVVYQPSDSTQVYTKLRFRSYVNGTLEISGLPEGSNTFRQFYNGQSFSSWLPTGSIFFEGGDDLENEDLIYYLTQNGCVVGYQQGSGNLSNLLEDSSDIGDVFVSYSISNIPSGSSISSSYRSGFDYGTNISFIYNYYPSNVGNYIFDGWYSDSGFTEKIDSVGTTVRLTRSITVYGRYVYRAPTYSIIFVSNGGSEVNPLVNQTAVPSQLPLPSRYAYSFSGWYTDSDLQTPVVPGASLSSDLTLYAGWTFVPGHDVYVDPSGSLRGMFTGLTESFLTAFLTISSQIGFGGITLLSILSTVIVILLIYYVVRVIRG